MGFTIYTSVAAPSVVAAAAVFVAAVATGSRVGVAAVVVDAIVFAAVATGSRVGVAAVAVDAIVVVAAAAVTTKFKIKVVFLSESFKTSFCISNNKNNSNSNDDNNSNSSSYNNSNSRNNSSKTLSWCIRATCIRAKLELLRNNFNLQEKKIFSQPCPLASNRQSSNF